MRSVAFALAALLVALALARAPAARGGGDDPGALFTSRCANCHAVPDPAIATDRAWLDQVRRTA